MCSSRGLIDDSIYRDELEKQIREKLSEGFEVVSLTFHDEKVQSRGYGRISLRPRSWRRSSACGGMPGPTCG